MCRKKTREKRIEENVRNNRKGNSARSSVFFKDAFEKEQKEGMTKNISVFFGDSKMTIFGFWKECYGIFLSGS